MKIFFSNTYQPVAHAGRPSLYGESEKLPIEEEAFSILGRLEPNRKRRITARRIAWTTPLLSLAAVGLVLGLNGGFPDVDLPAGGNTASSGELARPQSIAAGRQLAAMPADAAASTAASTQGAMIAAEYLLEQDGGQGGEAAMSSTEAQRGTVVTHAAYEALPGVVLVAGAVANRNLPAAPAASGVARQAQTHSGQTSAAARTPVRTGTRKAAKDKDVELIGALLAHVSAHVSAPAAAPAKAPSRKPQAASAARRTRTAPSRENAGQIAGVSIDAQVKRCRELGFFEGEMCRLRVCSDQWGKNPACPASPPAASDS